MSKKQPQNCPNANGKLAFKLKILLIAILPIILVSGLTGWMIHTEANRLISREVKLVESRILEVRREELKNYTALALTAIRHIYADTGKETPQARKAVRQILHNLNYGMDGYFFAYDRAGTNLVNAPNPDLLGQNLWYKRDDKGRFFLQELMKRAVDGGGYYTFKWPKPSTGIDTLKLGYATLLPDWGWMIGTGSYLDDIKQEISALNKDMRATARHTEITFLIMCLLIIGITALSIAALHFNEHKLADEKLKALTQRIIDVQEEERKRVSNDLHDGLNQLLVSIRHRLELAMEQISNPTAAQPLMEKSLAILDTSIADVRRISKALHPSALANIGLSEAIRELGQDFEDSTQIKSNVIATRVDYLLPEAAKIALFRITQEALTNVVRHTDAKRLQILLCIEERTKGKKTITLSIEDDGTGFTDPSSLTTDSGLGLRNMFERVESHGGTLTFTKGELGGLKITIKIPQA
ncbi:cache domain-containing protein [uncultured Cohaesibacter sp.]|uniref:cache domain-containing protein n=1 Tax=uncultured Cohaesibacter sp. TaxID=1002546 RepID=UPI002AAA71B9|nr:cache domain-containing protein [uncultured Cohaesibacter sp.]